MNFLSEIEGKEIHVELKYCERCGGLWLRPAGASGIYCADCRTWLAAMPDPGTAPTRKPRRRRKIRPQDLEASIDRHSRDLHGPANIDDLQGVAAMEVRV